MRRKVIQIAESTQLISLPRQWALRHNIKKGDELEVVETGNTLVIQSPAKENQEKKIEITVESPDKFLRRMLFSPYIQGVTEMQVNYTDRKVFEKVSAEVNLLIGWEIIQQGATYCVIKSVATALEDDLDNIIRRIFMSTTVMMKDMAVAMEKKDYQQLDNLKILEETNNKLTYFSLRLLTKRGYGDHNKTNSIYYIVMLIEEIVDDLRDVCEFVIQDKMQLEKSTLDFFGEIISYFDQVHILFHKFSTDMLFQHNKKVKDLVKRILTELRKPSKDSIVLSNLHDILKLISHISKEIHY